MNDIKFVEPIFNRARAILGEPIRTVELTDGQMEELLENAKEVFHLLIGKEDKGLHFYRTWVNQYFIALCKESLGRIRGKFGGKVSIPGTELTIDYEDLLTESYKEKQFLKYLILDDENILTEHHSPILVFYVGIRNMDAAEVEEYIKDIREKITPEDGFIKYFVPIRSDDSRIECIYPTGGVNKEVNDLILEMKKELDEFTKKKGGLIGKVFSLDTGQIGPVSYEVVILTDTKVGLKATVGSKHLQLTRGDFEIMSGVKIKDYE